MRKLLTAGLLATTAIISAPAQAGVTIYTDRSAFLAALGAVSTEDFSDATLVSGLSYTSSVGTIAGDHFADQLAIGSQTTTFSFAGGTTAFGADFDLTPGGAGIGIALTLTPGGAVSTEISRNYSGQFFGLISTDVVDSITLAGGSQESGVETYNLDNLTFAQSTVPEPASWGLMLIGFGLSGAVLRSRRKATVTFA